MVNRIRRLNTVGVMAGVAVLAWMGLAGNAGANPTIMQKANQRSCAVCHDSRSGVVPSIETLNPAGHRYLRCGFAQSCYDAVTASLPPPGQDVGTIPYQPQPPAGQYQPAPQYQGQPPAGQYQPVPQYQAQPPAGQYQPAPQYQGQPPTGQYQPAPQYQAQPPAGQYQPAPQYQQPPQVGMVQPQSGPMAEIPVGAYRGQCREMKLGVSRVNLFAVCGGPGGASMHTVLENFRDCESEIYVDAGYLRCRLRGGGLNRALRYIDVYNNQSLLAIDSVKLKGQNENRWTERLRNPIQPRTHGSIYIEAAQPCMMRIQLGALWDKLKDDMDTCRFSRITDNDRDYSIN